MEATSVSEIHRYALRPVGFEEPLFATAASKGAVMEHLLEAPWLARASELEALSGESAHAVEEPVELRNRDGRTELVWWSSRGRRSCFRSTRTVIEILDRWREVRGWWDGEGGVDRTVYRVLLSGDAVVDVARDRSGDWSLVGLAD